ncbi:MAG: DNA-3-methyladenine glycosylase [bacterium]|nr:DNA-3-methyladenine glycosylase [bacterium]
MRKILRGEFFNRPTLKVARELLGKFLVRKQGRKMVALMITDVEAYIGHRDRASHASRGKTARNALMFGQAGYWYIYFTYGMHWMLNIVTEGNGYPAAILIRGVQNISGPARITKFLKIDKKLNGKSALRVSGLWIEDRGVKVASRMIKKGKRVGVDYAGEWKNRPWRFFINSLV